VIIHYTALLSNESNCNAVHTEQASGLLAMTHVHNTTVLCSAKFVDNLSQNVIFAVFTRRACFKVQHMSCACNDFRWIGHGGGASATTTDMASCPEWEIR
jgi:hypothetical protein